MKRPSNTQYVWTGIAFMGVVLLGALFVFGLYFPKRLEDATIDIVTERKAKLSEVNSKERELISQYAWLDKPKGMVRIPIGQAMKLVVADLSKKN